MSQVFVDIIGGDVVVLVFAVLTVFEVPLSPTKTILVYEKCLLLPRLSYLTKTALSLCVSLSQQ